MACPSLEGFLSYLRKRRNRGVANLAGDGNDVVDDGVPVVFLRKVAGKGDWVATVNIAVPRCFSKDGNGVIDLLLARQ